MFDNQKYITKGVELDIPQYLQNMMWYMIQAMVVTEKDYLQVFRLESVLVDGVPQQKITHTQEQPEYKDEQVFKVEVPIITAKIFVIDDESHCTMLLADEY